MSYDHRNSVTIVGGLLAIPELVADGKLLKLRIGVDYAGSPRPDEDQEKKSGYFNVNYWLNDDNQTTRFVKSQAESWKPGTQLAIQGRLKQERFKTKDDKNGESVLIVAESIQYYGNKRPAQDGEKAESADAPAEKAEAGASTGGFKF